MWRKLVIILLHVVTSFLVHNMSSSALIIDCSLTVKDILLQTLFLSALICADYFLSAYLSKGIYIKRPRLLHCFDFILALPAIVMFVVLLQLAVVNGSYLHANHHNPTAYGVLAPLQFYVMEAAFFASRILLCRKARGEKG